jgi:hypothetical protein
VAYFDERDRQLIEGLTYRPDLAPGFEALKGCLVWADEYPQNVSSAGYDRLSDLWIARTIICHDPSRRTLDDARYRAAWTQAKTEGIRWPGFHRETLSETDRRYYERMCEDGGV